MPDSVDLIKIQVLPSAPQSSVTSTATDMVLPLKRAADRLRHFPDNIYDLSSESHLSRFLKVLLGDAGAGQLRKRLNIQRMRATLQGSHFYDLDRFYGPLFGIKRVPDELLAINPYAGTATRDQWDDAAARDASFRSRIEQFARAITFGATPVGMELISEALLAVDCEINEVYIQADDSFQTWQELEDQFGVLVNSENMVSLETDVTDWIGEGNSTVARSTAWAFPDGFTPGGGVASLEVTSIGVGDMAALSNNIPALVGVEYSFSATVLTSVTRNIRVEISWVDNTPATISTSVGPNVLVQAGQPTGVEVTGVAPVGTDTVRLRAYVVATGGASEVHNFDRLQLTQLNYKDMEGVTWGDLEGLGGAQLAGNDRRLFVVRPKRQITEADAYFLSRVLNRLKPADVRFEIDTKGVLLHEPLTIGGVLADSIHWEIIPKVVPFSPASNLPYTVITGDPEEQPRPPFSGYQGEAWSYISDLSGVAASHKLPDEEVFLNSLLQRVVYDNGTSVDFPPEQAILPARVVQSGRGISDAILVSYPYATQFGILDQFVIDRTAEAIAQLYVDGVPLDALNTVLETLPRTDPFQQNPENRYWVSPARSMDNPIEEILEIRLNQESWVNYITFETVKYPHRVIVEMYDRDGGVWNEAFRQDFIESFPKYLTPGLDVALYQGHPQHSFPNHWEKVSKRVEPRFTGRVRLRMQRIEGIPPRERLRTIGRSVETRDVDYTLAIRSLDTGYRVTSRSDIDFIEEPRIGHTVDMIGSQVYFDVQEQGPERAIDDSEVTAWRSEPQPVDYAVVNLYLDTREENGIEGSVIDRFSLNPTHVGPSLSIYYSNDPHWPTENVLFLDGSGYAVTPNTPDLEIDGDIDVRVRASMADWTDAIDERTFVSKRNVPVNVGGDEWQFRTTPLPIGGRLQFVWWDTVGTPHPDFATEDTGFEPGSIHWVRCVRSGTTLTFWVSDDDTNDHTEVNWTQLGDPVVTVAGTIRNDVANSMTIGAKGTSVVTGEHLNGVVKAVAVLHNGVLVSDPIFSEWETGEVLKSDDQGHAWTLKGSAGIVGQEGDLTVKFMEDRDWRPIPRNYFVQKGYIHIPSTRARFFKFEFSNLVAEPYESFVPILREVKLFPQRLIDDLRITYGHAIEARLPGMSSSISTAESLRYRDALRVAGQEAAPLSSDQYRPTEALWLQDPVRQTAVRHEAWQYGFIPWHQSSEQYPRFNLVGKHVYENIQVLHDTKVAFFVGLREIKAYRTRFEKDENTVVYFDTYDDLRNLDYSSNQPGHWAFEPGFLTSEGHQIPVELRSRVFFSRDNVKAVQFATIQSDPVQLVRDHTFRDPILKTYQWNDIESFQRVGDAQLIYDQTDFSVVNIRHVIPTPKAIDRTGGIVQPILQPVFRQEPFEVADEAAAAATIGGFRTAVLPLSSEGRAYAAARFTMQTDQSSPMILRVYNQAGDVLIAEREFTARRGETVEGFVGFDIPAPGTAVYLQLVQEGKSDDIWKVYALSLFDDGMVWEFSNDGGSNWYPAIEIRNNEHGILTFPSLGNQLRYRVRGFLLNRWVSAIKIRPHYAGTGLGRPTGTDRGPNVSVYDQDVPIQSDPLFTTWTEPIPYWWFAASRRFPVLSAEGVTQVGQFSRSFARPLDDDVSGVTDAAEGVVSKGRVSQDSLQGLTGDVVTREVVLERDVVEDIYSGTTLSLGGTGFVSTPDAAPLSITGDIDIRADCALDNWTMPYSLLPQVLVNKSGAYSFAHGNWEEDTARLVFGWTEASVFISVRSLVELPLNPGQRALVRATHDVDNGSGSRVTTFYYNLGGGWVQLGDPVVFGTAGNIDDSTGSLTVSSGVVDQVPRGRIFSVEVRNGIDGVVVANPDFNVPPWILGSTVEDDSLGNPWTLGGGAEIVEAIDNATWQYIWQLGVAGRSEMGQTTWIGGT